MILYTKKGFGLNTTLRLSADYNDRFTKTKSKILQFNNNNIAARKKEETDMKKKLKDLVKTPVPAVAGLRMGIEAPKKPNVW